MFKFAFLAALFLIAKSQESDDSRQCETKTCGHCSKDDQDRFVECSSTGYIEIQCDDNKSIIKSCHFHQKEGIWKFWFYNMVIGITFFIGSRKRQNFLNEKRNRKLQTQLSSL